MRTLGQCYICLCPQTKEGTLNRHVGSDVIWSIIHLKIQTLKLTRTNKSTFRDRSKNSRTVNAWKDRKPDITKSTITETEQHEQFGLEATWTHTLHRLLMVLMIRLIGFSKKKDEAIGWIINCNKGKEMGRHFILLLNLLESRKRHFVKPVSNRHICLNHTEA